MKHFKTETIEKQRGWCIHYHNRPDGFVNLIGHCDIDDHETEENNVCKKWKFDLSS